MANFFGNLFKSKAEIAWEKASLDNTKKSLLEFLAAYPEGKFSRQAQSLLFKIEDEEAWEKAQKLNTPDVYLAYYHRSKEGKFRQEARTAFEIIMNAKKEKEERARQEKEFMNAKKEKEERARQEKEKHVQEEIERTARAVNEKNEKEKNEKAANEEKIKIEQDKKSMPLVEGVETLIYLIHHKDDWSEAIEIFESIVLHTENCGITIIPIDWEDLAETKSLVPDVVAIYVSVFADADGFLNSDNIKEYLETWHSFETDIILYDLNKHYPLYEDMYKKFIEVISPTLIIQEAEQGLNSLLELLRYKIYCKEAKKKQILLNFGSESMAIKLMFVRGGVFEMGSNRAIKTTKFTGIREYVNTYEYPERPIHKVEVNDFWIGEKLITFDIFNLYCKSKGAKARDNHGFGKNSHPIINFTYGEAIEFCNWFSSKTGKKITLLSEAQWEYAAKGGILQSNHFGQQLMNRIYFAPLKHGWFEENSKNKIHPVGKKKPNGLGVFDMIGNVFEICLDDWHPNYEGAPTNDSPWLDSGINLEKVIRGGTYDYHSEFAESEGGDWFAYRESIAINERTFYSVGLRICCQD